MPESKHVVTHEPAARRFSVETPAGPGELTYTLGEGRMDLRHTGVPAAAEGQGFGTALVAFALEHARTAGLRVVPSCPFVAAYIREHPESQDLVAE